MSKGGSPCFGGSPGLGVSLRQHLLGDLRGEGKYAPMPDSVRRDVSPEYVVATIQFRTGEPDRREDENPHRPYTEISVPSPVATQSREGVQANLRLGSVSIAACRCVC